MEQTLLALRSEFPVHSNKKLLFNQLTAVCPPPSTSESFLESWMWNGEPTSSAFTTSFSTKDIHLRPFIATLNCGLWQLHLLVFLNFLRLLHPASLPKIRTDPRNHEMLQIARSSHIPPITISIWLQVCVLHMNPQTPGSTHYEEPAMTYIL